MTNKRIILNQNRLRSRLYDRDLKWSEMQNILDLKIFQIDYRTKNGFSKYEVKDLCDFFNCKVEDLR